MFHCMDQGAYLYYLDSLRSHSDDGYDDDDGNVDGDDTDYGGDNDGDDEDEDADGNDDGEVLCEFASVPA